MKFVFLALAGALLLGAAPAEAQRGHDCSHNCDWKRDRDDYRRYDDRNRSHYNDRGWSNGPAYNGYRGGSVYRRESYGYQYSRPPPRPQYGPRPGHRRQMVCSGRDYYGQPYGCRPIRRGDDLERLLILGLLLEVFD